MKNLLLAISVILVAVSFTFFRACGSNSVKKDSVNDSLTNEDLKEVKDNPMDTSQSKHSGIQNTDPMLVNQQNGMNGDTSKKIHYHQSPNQYELDSIKKAKTKLKNN